LLLAALAASATLSAQTCERPHPFDHTSAIRGAASFVAGDGAACDIVASLDAANSVPSGAFAWYSLPSAPSPWRISFRIDLSGFDTNAPITSTDILTATAEHPSPVGGPATLLRVVLAAFSGNGPDAMLLGKAACNDAQCAPGGYMYASLMASRVSSGDLLRFEVDSGAGAAGQVKWWINADFTDPPTGTFDNLDNAQWGGVRHVALGAAQPYGLAATNGATLRFSEVDSPYDTLFWSGFDE
jgi:hypothetical protein